MKTSDFSALYMSSPYPGPQTYPGHPMGLLYALSVLAEERREILGSTEAVANEITVLAPPGVNQLQASKLEQDLEKILETQNPNLIGISTFSSSYKNACGIASLAKELNPDIISLFGGAHEDNFIQEYVERGFIDADVVIGGNAPHVLASIHNAIQTHDLTSSTMGTYLDEHKSNFEKVSGAAIILYNSEKGLETIRTKGDFQPIGALPLPPRYLQRDEKDIAQSFSVFNTEETTYTTAQMMLGEGCPMSCNFCSEGIKKVWFADDAPKAKQPRRSIDHIRSELDDLTERGYDAIFFDDSTFFAKPKPELEQLFALLSEYDFKWAAQTTAKSMVQNLALLPKASASGMSYIYFGIEHVNQEIVDSFGGNKKQVINMDNLFSSLDAVNVKAGLSLTFGHPDLDSYYHKTKETKESVKEAITYVSGLQKSYPKTLTAISLNLVTYHPGTPISVDAKNRRLFVDYTGLPNAYEPFTKFEEGMGDHPFGVNTELVDFIYTYAKKEIGDVLLFPEGES